MKLILFITALVAMNAIDCAPIKANDEIQIVKEATKEELDYILKKLREKEEKEEEGFYFDFYYDRAYISDINNDGNPEYIFTTYVGTGNFFSFSLYALENDKLIELDEPENHLEFPFGFMGEFINPLTESPEFLVQVNNLIYICTDDDVYLWKDEKCISCGDDFWMNQRHGLFNKLCEKDKNSAAFHFLSDFEKRWRSKINKETDLCIRNDLALCALKNCDYNTCLKMLEELRQELKSIEPQSEIVKAVESNEKLLKKEISGNGFWMKRCRSIFNELYKEKKYLKAFNFLSAYEKHWRTIINKETDLWIRNDLALCALKNCNYSVCLDYLDDIQAEPAFKKSSKKLTSAVECNEKMCKEEIAEFQKNGTKGKYNYDWLISYKDKPTNDNQRWYKDNPDRANCLFNAAIPYLRCNDKQSIISYFDLSEHDNQISIDKNRYVSLFGYKPYIGLCEFCGFLWCDIKDKVSIVSTINPDEKEVYITSASLLKNEIPSLFFDNIEQWLIKEEIVPESIVFQDRLGSKNNIVFNKNKINAEIKKKSDKKCSAGFITMRANIE